MTPKPPRSSAASSARLPVLGAPRPALGIVRGISYGLFRPPDPFVGKLRALGARLLRVYVYWSQIEPEPGRVTYEVVDHLLGQLDGTERVWITVCSSSRWATRQATDFLPPSPAKDAADYRRFVRGLVAHCAGRVHAWQCDNEPSNVGLTWSGTAAEYLAQLRVMHDAVRDADPAADVILGGAPYALPVATSDSPEGKFFDEVLREGRDAFDLFDLHLYGPPDRIPADVEAVRRMMRAYGYEKPVVAGEYGGPVPDMFPEAQAALEHAMGEAFAAAARGGAEGALLASNPDAVMRQAVGALYDRMPRLPPQLQMFMAGCDPTLEAKRHRIACREIVTRNMLALGAGVRATVCWKLAPEIASYEDPHSVMELFYGKLLLMTYTDGDIAHRQPAARTFALLAERLQGTEAVVALEAPADPRVAMFEVHRAGRGPLLVVWRRGDPFSGEDEPPGELTWPWPQEQATAIDALGAAHSIDLRAGRLTMPISVTPVFIASE